MNKPGPEEYNPYYEKYISLMTEPDIRVALAAQPAEIRSALAGVPEEKGAYAYAEGKWSIKELLSHLIDGERIFAYRALRISRGDTTPIEGFEQDDYITNSHANDRSFASLLDELELQRRSNLLMLDKVDDAASSLMGIASDSPVSARAIVYIMGGHIRHHVTLLKERYLA
ncbi:MAG: DinB family protein [Acidobacteriota bacterium]